MRGRSWGIGVAVAALAGAVVLALPSSGATAEPPPGVPYEQIFGAQPETSAREAFKSMLRTDLGRQKIMELDPGETRSNLLRRWLTMGTKGRVLPKLVGGFNIASLAITGYLIYREIDGEEEWYEIIFNDDLGPDGLPTLENPSPMTGFWEDVRWSMWEDPACNFVGAEVCFLLETPVHLVLGNAQDVGKEYEPFTRVPDIAWCLDDFDRLSEECASILGRGFYGNAMWEAEDHRLYYQGRRQVAQENAVESFGGQVVTVGESGDGEEETGIEAGGAWGDEVPIKVAMMTQSQMEAALASKIEEINKLDEAPDEGDYAGTVNINPGANAPNDDDIDAVGTALDDDCGRALINWLMDDDNYDPPATCLAPAVSDPFVIPKPGVNETYAQYVTRLRSLGWLGDVTDVDEEAVDDYWQGFGPRAVLRITSATAGLFLDRQDWPVGAAQRTIQKNDDLEFLINPATAPEAPTDGVGGGSGPPPKPDPDVEEDCPCPIDEINLAPLGEIDDGCDKFPFGVFCWVADQLDTIFGAEPRAPHTSFTLPGYSTPIGVIPEVELEFDLADERLDGVFDAYFGIMRAALGFLLWLGGLFYMGSRMLGRHEAPDPSLDDEMGH